MWSGKFKNGESFNDLTDAEIEKFSNEIDENTVKEVIPQSVDNNLYTKALQVGYSGLSDDEKDKLDYQYAKSAASKTMKIEEVHAKMDANAAVSKKMAEESKDPVNPYMTGVNPSMTGENPIEALKNTARDSYQAARDVIAKGLSPFAGALEYGWDRLVEPQGHIDPTTGYVVLDKKDYVQLMQEAEKRGQTGEGIIGMASDPVNLIAAGLPVTNAPAIASKLGVAGKYLGPIRVGAEAAKGAGTIGASDILSGKTEDLPRDLALGALLGGTIGSFTGKPSSRLAKQEEDALRTFPGDQYFRTQANKGAEVYEPLSVEAKKDILGSIQAPYDKESWIRYYEDVSKKAKAGYDAADKIAETYKGLPGSEIPMSELKSKMINDMNKGVGQYSKRDAEQFVNKKLAGFIDKYGENGKVPVHELGAIKGKFSEDIFDPRFSVAEGTTTKRTLARKAGSSIEDYRKQPAYTSENPVGEASDLTKEPVKEFLEKLKTLSDEDKIRALSQLEDAYGELNTLSYNDLLEKVAPGTKDLYKRAQMLEDIFQYQPERIGSQRTGKGILGKLFEGATHEYGPSGNAYVDPVMLLRKSKSTFPETVSKVGDLSKLVGTKAIGSLLGLSSSEEDNKKKKK